MKANTLDKEKIIEKINSLPESYWKKRFKKIEADRNNKVTLAEDELYYLFSTILEEILQLVENFLYKYNTTTAYNPLTRTELRELKRYVSVVQKDMENEGLEFDKDIQRQIKGITSRIGELGALKLKLSVKLSYLYGVVGKRFNTLFEEVASDFYYRTLYEVIKASGYDSKKVSDLELLTLAELLSSSYRPTGESFDDVIWRLGKTLVHNTTTLVGRVMPSDNNEDSLERLEKTVGSNWNALKRDMETDLTYVSTLAQSEAFTTLEIEEAVFTAILDERTSDFCREADGNVIPVEEITPWENAPPLHYYCVLPDTKIASPDCEAISRSHYSGNIFKIRTANGGRVSITENHIMLTSRGWVRAKNLVKGDKVIYYCGWDEFLSKANPTDNDSVPTIENLFTTLHESFAMQTISMPATAKDFKGDVIEDSEIDIIPINSFLRSKLDSSISKFFSDFTFGVTSMGTVPFLRECSFSECLFALGLTADGIVSGSSIARILLRGALTHHELVSFRLPTDYYSRIYQTSSDSTIGNVIPSSELIKAKTAFIERDNLVNRKVYKCLRFSDGDIVFPKNPKNRFSRTTENLFDFVRAFSGIIQFDNVVAIERQFFSGFVYDITSKSTLYLCNGYMSSNCRSTLVPKVNKVNWLTGDVYEVDGNFDGWYESHWGTFE